MKNKTKCCKRDLKRNSKRVVSFSLGLTFLSPVLCVREFLLMEGRNEIQFVSTQRRQQKLLYRGWCYTLKRTNRNDKCWICTSVAVYTYLDATQVIRICGHADGCRIDPHTFYHQQLLNELKRLAAGYLRPVKEIYDELASSLFQLRCCRIFSVVGPGPEHNVLQPCLEISTTSGQTAGFVAYC
ncbi:hypothetical protein T01_6985 [Trichinella spiralis]|uniref:FLYWCH-type domain-containing protein n=1 Tax=Trichinella spiralis TaxID=6334 RepID=A0A0V1BXP4_TRISP|nr:hypothetical protein T01_6985 [Trichinella spiralis]